MLYDIEYLIEISDGDSELLDSMLSQFIDDATTSINHITLAVSISDYSSLKFNAHRIKPALVNFKIFSLIDTLRFIENKAADRVFDNELHAAVAEFKAVMQQIISDIKSRHLNKH